MRRILTLKRKPQVIVDRCALLRVRVPWYGDLSHKRKTDFGTSAITMRPGWLAQAAFVFEVAVRFLSLCNSTAKILERIRRCCIPLVWDGRSRPS